MNEPNLILGAGMTGLAAGVASGLPIYEAVENPGGICSSYYVPPKSSQRLHAAPSDGEAYRFEIGGGHWLFGGDPFVHRFIRSHAPTKSYLRRSSVYLPEKKLLVPYPIQNHLRYLGSELAEKALGEMRLAAGNHHAVVTMGDWLRTSFGATLCELFFEPFHEMYTAGLWKRIAPQDSYKSPVDLALAIRGAIDEAPPVGYNASFVYPEEGLNTFAQRVASQCDIRYGKRVVSIDVRGKSVGFEDGTSAAYETLLSTLPLNAMMKMTGLTVDGEPFPSPSVLVINIGARKGKRCPSDHWIYFSASRSGFHRVGFYSNVDVSFLPGSARAASDSVSIYVEKAYADGDAPGEAEVAALCRDTVLELQGLEWIGDAEVVDPTWIETAYTWAWPGSEWKEKSLQILEQNGIFPVGRYGRWVFQGIVDSIRDGLLAGSAFRSEGKQACASLIS